MWSAQYRGSVAWSAPRGRPVAFEITGIRGGASGNVGEQARELGQDGIHHPRVEGMGRLDPLGSDALLLERPRRSG